MHFCVKSFDISKKKKKIGIVAFLGNLAYRTNLCNVFLGLHTRASPLQSSLSLQFALDHFCQAQPVCLKTSIRQDKCSSILKCDFSSCPGFYFIWGTFEVIAAVSSEYTVESCLVPEVIAQFTDILTFIVNNLEIVPRCRLQPLMFILSEGV